MASAERLSPKDSSGSVPLGLPAHHTLDAVNGDKRNEGHFPRIPALRWVSWRTVDAVWDEWMAPVLERLPPPGRLTWPGLRRSRTPSLRTVRSLELELRGPTALRDASRQTWRPPCGCCEVVEERQGGQPG
jgi:hypothetical protein